MGKIIGKFHQAFQKLDSESIVSCYHNETEYKYSAFGKSKREHAKKIWRMLFQNEKRLKLEFSDIKTKKDKRNDDWNTYYTFCKTESKVHNLTTVMFKFKNGLINNHANNFNLHK